MRKFVLLLMFTSLVTKGYSQTITKQERGYFNLTEVVVFTGNNSLTYQISKNQISTEVNQAGSFGVRNINGWFLTSKISVGLGLGLENYTLSRDYFDYHNLFLLFFDARYYFKNAKNTFFCIC